MSELALVPSSFSLSFPPLTPPSASLFSLTTLNELRNRFDVGSSRKTSRKPVEEVTQMVLEAAGLGPGGIRLPLGETEGRGIGVKAVREIMSTREEYVSE